MARALDLRGGSRGTSRRGSQVKGMGCLLGFAVPWRLSCWIPIATEEALRLRETGAAAVVPAQAAATALAMGADRAVHVLRALTL